MSINIDEARVKGFETGVTLLAQQQGSRLRGAVRFETVGPGEEFSWDQIGSADPYEITTRHADTPLGDMPHYRRWAVPKTFARGELIDKEDQLRTINDFTNPYTNALGMGFGRQMDREIIAAAFATSKTGKSGTGTGTFVTATHQIVHGSAVLTLAKLNQAAKILRQYEEPKPWHIAVAADQVENVMNDSTITSADYNTVKLLMTGEINTFAGFEWHITELLSYATTNIRQCIAWSQNSLLLAMLREPSSDIGPRRDKNNAIQVYYAADYGATRMNETGVVEIQVDETAT